MSYKSSISTKFYHKLLLKEMSIADSETLGTQDGKIKDMDVLRSKVQGDITPMIEIGDFRFSMHQIMRIEIDETTMVPTISATLIDEYGAFTGAHFPKEKQIMKVYIRSKSDKMLPIRNDYLILGITQGGTVGEVSDNTEGVGNIYNISGILNIPKLYWNNSKSYPDMTSYDALMEVARELSIGFATNEDKTNDRMTWVSPNLQYLDFILHISNHAFKSDSDFYDVFIDRNYNLNFLNVNELLSPEFNLKDTFASLAMLNDYLRGDKGQDEKINALGKMPLILSNFSLLRGSDLYVQEFSQSSNFGSIILNAGSGAEIYYYDQFYTDDPKKNMIKVDLSLEDKDRSVIAAKEDEELNENTFIFWLGKDFGNNHDNFIFSKLNNLYSDIELKKIQLSVKTTGVNFNIYKGMSIPVVIVYHGTAHETLKQPYLQAENQADYDPDVEEFQKKSGMMIDKHLSGQYIILGAKYVFEFAKGPSSFSQYHTELSLGRRNWGTSPVIKK